jgi:hypothetical protein
VTAPRVEALLGAHHVPARVLLADARAGGPPATREEAGVWVEVVALPDDPLGTVYEGRVFDAETGAKRSVGGPRPGAFRSRLKAPMRRFWARECPGAPVPEGLARGSGRRR